MDMLARLSAIEEIKQLKARYFRFVDTQDWPRFRAILTDDVVFVPSVPLNEADAGIKIEGGDAVVAWIKKALTGASSVHRGFMPEIDITGPDQATGVWAMEDHVRWIDRSLYGLGYYHETYVRQQGVWRIKSFKLLRQMVDMQTHTPGRAG